MHRPAVDIRADMDLHAEIPLLALLGLVHLRVAFPLAFLVEVGAWMIVASTIVPCDTSSPLVFSRPVTPSNRRVVKSCRSSKRRKLRIVVSSGRAATTPGKSRKPAQALHIVERILHLTVRQSEPLLKKVNPQHRGQPDRRTTPPAGPRIVRLHHPQQLRPRHHRLHLAKNNSRRVRRFLFAYFRSEKLA